MKVKVESEKVGLKLNIQKTKIMASSPITSWEIDGVKHLLLGGKDTTKPVQCIKKQRHHFAYKGSYSQSYGFSSSHVHM